MLGTTLEEIRTHVESLASEDGAYFLVCARYGDRPVPAADLRFETRATARAAARATEQYRAALRRYDPRVPRYDVIVSQDSGYSTPEQSGTDGESAGVNRGSDRAEATDRGPEPGSDGSVDRWRDAGSGSNVTAHDRSSRVEFCHRVAGAVFEALSDCGHDAVESAVMDAYFELAERVDDLDDLCLCLLESMAAEIDRRLTLDEQGRVVETAVSRLPGPDSTDHPVAATLASLERRGLVGAYNWSPAADRKDPERGDPDVRDVVVRLSEYALSPRDDRLPLLPMVVELARHQSTGPVASLQVVDVDDGWQVRLRRDTVASPEGLVTAPIDPDV